MTITVTNDGDHATGAFTAAIDGGAPDQFSITGSGCFGALAPGAHCAFSVIFAPPLAFGYSATFELSVGGSFVAQPTVWGWGT